MFEICFDINTGKFVLLSKMKHKKHCTVLKTSLGKQDFQCFQIFNFNRRCRSRTKRKFVAWYDDQKRFSVYTDKSGLTIHVYLHRQTFEGVYVSHRCVPHSLAVKFSTFFNTGFPQSEAVHILWELLRSPEPSESPGGPVASRNAASQSDTLPREDPWISWHHLRNSSKWGHRGSYRDKHRLSLKKSLGPF